MIFFPGLRIEKQTGVENYYTNIEICLRQFLKFGVSSNLRWNNNDSGVRSCAENYLVVVINAIIVIDYEWVKRTKFLLAVIYGSACRHSIRSKTFKKNLKNVR